MHISFKGKACPRLREASLDFAASLDFNEICSKIGEPHLLLGATLCYTGWSTCSRGGPICVPRNISTTYFLWSQRLPCACHPTCCYMGQSTKPFQEVRPTRVSTWNLWAKDVFLDCGAPAVILSTTNSMLHASIHKSPRLHKAFLDCIMFV